MGLTRPTEVVVVPTTKFLAPDRLLTPLNLADSTLSTRLCPSQFTLSTQLLVVRTAKVSRIADLATISLDANFHFLPFLKG